MSAQNLRQAVCDIVAELTGVKASEVRDTDRLREDLGLDSLQSMELLSRVSEHFSIDPDLDVVMKLSTVREVVQTLGEYLGTQAAAAGR